MSAKPDKELVRAHTHQYRQLCGGNMVPDCIDAGRICTLVLFLSRPGRRQGYRYGRRIRVHGGLQRSLAEERIDLQSSHEHMDGYDRSSWLDVDRRCDGTHPVQRDLYAVGCS